MATLNRYTGPNGEAVPPLTRPERTACGVASMLRWLETGEYVQYQPSAPPKYQSRTNKKKKRRPA